MLKQAAILVGGLGTRLNERTRSTPKPLLPVGGRPFLDYILDEVVRHGFDDVLLLAGHLGGQIEDRYHNRPWRNGHIRVITESAPLGTGGALRFAAPYLDRQFLLLNGDTFFDINLRALTQDVPTGGLVMALRVGVEGARFGRVTLSKGKVRSFHAPEERRTGPINGGIYCLSRDVALAIPPEKTSLEGDVFPILADRGLIRGLEYRGFFLDIGVPDDLARAEDEMPMRTKRRAIFFDRDGVLNNDTGYVHRRQDFHWTLGAKQAIRLCNDSGYLVFIVTNQAGVAHGYYSENDVQELHRWISEELAECGAHIDAIEYCPHHVDGKSEKYRQACRRRKPECGMIDDVLAHWSVDLAASLLVGDKQIDMDAAEKAHIQGHLFEGGDLLAFIRAKLDRKSR